MNLYLTILRPKSDGGIRVILNLKPFNQQYFDKIHSKMESLKSAINSMTPSCLLASVVLLLLAFCLLLLLLWESVIVLCFVVRYYVSILVLQSP